MHHRRPLAIGWSSAVVVAVAILMVGTGCQAIAPKKDPARERTEQAVNLLVDTRQGLTAGDEKVMESQAALRTLRDAQGDLRPAFNAFREKVEVVRREADRVRAEADVVRSQGFLYASARHSDVSTIKNPQMRTAALERTANVRERYEQINVLYAQTNRAFSEYVRHCDDLQTYLANELNFPALESCKKWIAETNQSGEALRTSMRQLSDELSLTSNILSPTPVPVPMAVTPAATAPTTTTVPSTQRRY